MVSERGCQSGGAAVHHAGVHEGSDGVELLSVRTMENSCTTAGCRSEEGHAILDAITAIGQRYLQRSVINY